MTRHRTDGKTTASKGVDNPALEPDDPPAPQHIPLGAVLADGGDTRTRTNGYLTLEALPRMEYYKNQAEKRPSIGELQGEVKAPQITEKAEDLEKNEFEHSHIKLGWIQGVLIPCLLNIWGVMLFLRLSWVVGQSGILSSLLIIAMSAVVCVITTLSLSAISTNGEVKGGGIYYIISRSLGPEFGASVGVIFAFANAVAASMNTIGFCDSFNTFLASFGLKIIDGAVNDVRLVGVIAILLMVLICTLGMDFESKTQNFLIIIIILAIFDFIIGAIMGPQSDLSRARGFEGLSWSVFSLNFMPDYRFSEGMNQDVFSVFAIFFPSVTGLQAGANISGDLRDPAGAIPKGTLLALLISMGSYALFVLLAGGGALRDASGSVAEYLAGNHTDCAGRVCEFGLHNSYEVMQLMSLWEPLIFAGCWAATLSTALTNLLSVPRLIQALGRDQIYPGLIFFAKGYGRHGEPYRGYVLTFVISSAFLLIADLNAIAPLITNFYLASYALINFCTFHAALIRPLGWRPTFRFYNKWLSLFGAVLCVAIMCLISWMTTLITFAIFILLYLIVIYRKPDVNWGSSTQAQRYKSALSSLLKLSVTTEHVKNYRPQVLVLCGQPQNRPPLVDLANLITKNNSLMMCAEICKNRLSYQARTAHIQQGNNWLNLRKIKGFFTVVDGYPFEIGAHMLFQASGVGKLKPNVLMMGFKSDWMTCSKEDMQGYFSVLHDAFQNRMSAVILRLAEGLDFSKPQEQLDYDDLHASHMELSNGGGMIHNDSNLSMILQQNVLSQTSLSISGSKKIERPTMIPKVQNDAPSLVLRNKKKKIAEEILHQYPNGEKIQQNILDNMRTFDKKTRWRFHRCVVVV
uniref:Amino acid permease/ SLC12A domain-containing protein n=2 Tax=Clastoptera arizonana TaxID=38151 RepID=A0A1B6CFU0_9HEMI